jgi:PAS domain S-box-containing protein
MERLVQAAPLLVFSSDAQGRMFSVSSAVREYAGLEADDVKSPARLAEGIHPDDRPRAVERWLGCLESGTVFEIEMRLRRSDGGYYWHMAVMAPVRNEAGEIVQWFGTATDIDQRRRIEERERLLAHSAIVLASGLSPDEILRQLPRLLVPTFAEWASVYLCSGPDTCIRVANAHHGEALRPLAEESLLPLDSNVIGRLAAVILTGKAELRSAVDLDDDSLGDLPRRAGFRSSVLVPLKVDGIVIGAVTAAASRPRHFVEDDLSFLQRFADFAVIAVRNQRTNEELKRQGDELRYLATVVAAAPQAIVGFTLEDTIASWNPGAERLFGYTEEEAIGRPAALLRPPEYVEEMQRLLSRAYKRREPEVLETKRRHKDGHPIDVALHFSPILGENGEPVGGCAVYEDISRRRRAEAALRESESRLRAAVSAAPVVSFQQDRNLRYTWIHNPHPDFRSEEVLGKTDHDLLPPQDANTLTAIKARVIETGQPDRQEVTTTIAGERFHYELSVEPLRDETGAIVGVTCASYDITTHKHAQDSLREHEALLRDAMAVKDQFVSLVSHELLTPVTLMVGNGRLLLQHGDVLPPAEKEQALTEVVTEGGRLRDIIENMLLLTRLEAESLDLEPVRLERLAEEQIASFRRRSPGREVALSIAPEVPIALGQPTLVAMVLDNLLSNADKYSPPGAPIEVYVLSNGANGVELRVRDHGIGLDGADLERIFSPFYRSPQASGQVKGMGLGLAVCRRIVDALKGTIWAENHPEGGAEFAVSFMSSGGVEPDV